MNHPKEPTQAQCGDQERLEDFHGQPCYAMWYPQMGGYVGRAALVLGGDYRFNCCFDAYIWHDGESPFRGDGEDARNPIRLHHCDPQQFIEFGQQVLALQIGLGREVEEDVSGDQHLEELVAVTRREVENAIPDFAKVCQDAEQRGLSLMLPQEAFAENHKREELTLLGRAIKYAGLHGLSTVIFSQKRL